MRVILRRLLLSMLVGAGSAITATLAVTVADLYLTGHGSRGLGDEWLTWSAAGVHLSIGDIIMLGAALLAAGCTWAVTGPSRSA
jgi:hypothetical protein